MPGIASSTSITRNNDAFTARNQRDDTTIEVSGKVEDGKPSVDEIKVTEGKKTKTYKSVDKVPEEHRDLVKKLVDAAAGKGIRFEFRTPPRREEN